MLSAYGFHDKGVADMSSPLEGLKPSLIWKYFDQILAIPHGSGNERALGDHLVSVAKSLKLEAKKDRVGNVLVRKRASSGREKAEGLILQGHMDMVCEKNSDVAHDFLKDAIRPQVKGDWVQASGTTLGADNGLGVAACLAVMEDASLVHGPLEFLFTVDEETGLTGARKIEKGFLKSKRMINLDSEEEGTFTIGCAGGADTEIIFPLARKKTVSKNLSRLKLYGLRGGHSGIDIHQGCGNAIKLLTRMLWQAQREFRFSLVNLEGGNKRNAIPREAWADLAVDPACLRPLGAFFKKAFEKIRVEYKAVETEIKYSFGKSETPSAYALTADSQRAFLNGLLAIPHGVIAMHPEIIGLVETSTNLAIVHPRRSDVQIICSTRSSIASALEATRNVIRSVSELAGAKISQPEGYPGWMPDLQSPLLQTLKGVYEKTFGKQPEIKAVHAGLECGIIGEKYPGMDMISFGPTIKNPHSPDERAHIGSVEKFWRFLKTALDALA